jgi:hypothetical protein
MAAGARCQCPAAGQQPGRVHAVRCVCQQARLLCVWRCVQLQLKLIDAGHAAIDWGCCACLVGPP